VKIPGAAARHLNCTVAEFAEKAVGHGFGLPRELELLPVNPRHSGADDAGRRTFESEFRVWDT
jgi:hypothetical protein